MTSSIIETERLRLRPPTVDDLDDLAAFFRDPVVMKFSLGRRSRTETRAWIDRQATSFDEHGYGHAVVTNRETDEFVGTCGILRFDDVDGQVEHEIGYRLHPDMWGQGFATEAACGVRDHGFDVLGFERLISLIEPANARSIAVAERVGMSLDKEINFWNRPVRVYTRRRGRPSG